MDKLEKRQDDYESRISGMQSDRFTKLDEQISKLRSNLLRLCVHRQELEKSCQVEELSSVATNVSIVQSRYIAKATIDIKNSPPTLATSLDGKFHSLVGVTPGVTNTDKKEAIAATMAWSSSIKSAFWDVDDRKLTVSFNGGHAVFTPEISTTRGQLEQMAIDLNDISAVFDKAQETSVENPAVSPQKGP